MVKVNNVRTSAGIRNRAGESRVAAAESVPGSGEPHPAFTLAAHDCGCDRLLASIRGNRAPALRFEGLGRDGEIMSTSSCSELDFRPNHAVTQDKHCATGQHSA